MLLYKLYIYTGLCCCQRKLLIYLEWMWPNYIKTVEVTSDLAWTSPTPNPGFLKDQEALRLFLQMTFYWYKIASYPNMEPILDVVGRAVCNFSRRLQKTPPENRWMIHSVLEKLICRLITPVSYCTAPCVNIAIKWSWSCICSKFCWLRLSARCCGLAMILPRSVLPQTLSKPCTTRLVPPLPAPLRRVWEENWRHKK